MVKEMVSNLNKKNITNIRPTRINRLEYRELSVLGKSLYNIAKEIETSDDICMTEEMIQDELSNRRGGYSSQSKEKL